MEDRLCLADIHRHGCRLWDNDEPENLSKRVSYFQKILFGLDKDHFLLFKGFKGLRFFKPFKGFNDFCFFNGLRDLSGLIGPRPNLDLEVLLNKSISPL
jgi:hypothetical protein